MTLSPARRVVVPACFSALAALASALAACGGPPSPTDGAMQSDAHPDVLAPDATGDAPQVDPDASDSGPPDAPPDAPPDGPFVPGAHEPFPQVPDQGGARLRHPHIVTVTFADDTRRPTLEAFTQFLVGSHWLTTVGAEYGIGAGVALDPVRLTTNAPDAIDSFGIEDLLTTGFGDGSITPPETTGDPTLYVVHFPGHTTVTLEGGSQSCMQFGGFHADANYMGTAFAYAVVDDCGTFGGTLSADEQTEFSTSHEIIEAATDALPLSQPAYSFPRPMSMTDLSTASPWILIGGELGDLCDLPPAVTHEGGHALQRVWSNAVAAMGTADPCVPADPAAPFYGTTASPNTLRIAMAGDVVHYDLRGFSNRPVADWRLSSRTQGPLMPLVSISARTLNNGGTATLDVTIPATAHRGQYAQIYLYSSHSMTDYAIWPLAIIVQ